MTIREVLINIRERLQNAGIEDFEYESWAFLDWKLHIDRAEFYMNPNGEVKEELLAELESVLKQREQRVPLQYLMGECEFMGYDFYVDERVLIPRPETELLAERAIAALREHPHPVALDLCCGNGALAVSMALEVPGAQVHAADLSPDALAVTAKNAELLGASVTLHQGDLFAAVPEIAFDVIVSNPPYIPSADCLTLQEEVRREPMMALDGGADGLNFYRRIASDAPKFLRPGGVLLLEVGFDQAEAVMALLADFADVRAHEDYQHIPRMIEARKHV